MINQIISKGERIFDIIPYDKTTMFSKQQKRKKKKMEMLYNCVIAVSQKNVSNPEDLIKAQALKKKKKI